MKVSVLLAAISQTMLVAAAATAGTALQTTGANADIAAAAGIETIFTSNGVEAAAACGGLTPAQCRSVCRDLHRRCWGCSRNYCVCSNTGC